MKRYTSPLTSRSLRSQLALGTPLALILTAALSACGEAEPRELGFTQAAQDLSTEPVEPFFEDGSQFEGRWVGTAVDTLALRADGSLSYRFPSGSTRILLELSVREADLAGTLTLGDAEPPPPVVDPDLGYPEGVSYDELWGYEVRERAEDGTETSFFLQTSFRVPPFEGFAYHVRPTSGISRTGDSPLELADGVVSLGFNSHQPLEDWCQQQTAHPAPTATGFSCLPQFGGGMEIGSDGTGKLCKLYGEPNTETCLPDLSNYDECYQEGEVMAELDCDRVTMCAYGVCDCYESGCVAASAGERLSLRRVGEELVGLFEGTVFKNARGLNIPLGEVRLRRVE